LPNSASEPRWFTVDDLIATNLAVVAATEEPYALRDPQLLDSASAVPPNNWHYGGERDIVALATALLFAVARNHPFLQGNKRTGFAAAINFLTLNGWQVSNSFDAVHFAELIVEVLEGASEPHAFTTALRPYVEAIKTD
jgi:death-on-curing protein